MTTCEYITSFTKIIFPTTVVAGKTAASGFLQLTITFGNRFFTPFLFYLIVIQIHTCVAAEIKAAAPSPSSQINNNAVENNANSGTGEIPHHLIDRLPANRSEALILGRVSHSPRKHYSRLKGIVDYVAAKLQDQGIRQGAVIFAQNNEEMLYLLRHGHVDWVTETAISAKIFAEKAGAEIILRRWKKGSPDYTSVIFSRTDVGINSIADLKGKKIVFSDPGSTSGFFLPMAIVQRNNLELVWLPTPQAPVPPDKVGYVFCGGDELNTTTWVYKRLVDAGAINNEDWESPSDTPPVFKKNLHIIHESEKVPRVLELLSSNVGPRLRTRIKQILLAAPNDPQAAKALNDYDDTTHFDDYTDEIKAIVDKLYEHSRPVMNIDMDK